MAELFKNKYRISSPRLSTHNYDGGAYFVTICTAERLHYFGEIVDCKMQLSPIGIYISENLSNISIHYPYAEIQLFTVMPNHIHAIIVIDGEKIANECAIQRRDVACNASTPKNKTMSAISPKRGTLSTVVRGIKSAVTKFAHENNINFAWQPRFHEHIIRNNLEGNRIADYIENNVAKWDLDSFHNIN